MMNRAFKRRMGRLLIALLLPALLCPAALADDQTADTLVLRRHRAGNLL